MYGLLLGIVILDVTEMAAPTPSNSLNFIIMRGLIIMGSTNIFQVAPRQGGAPGVAQ